MRVSTFHFEGVEFHVTDFEDGTYQASHSHGLVGFGRSPIAACVDAHSVESGYAIYPALQYINEQLNRAYNDCGNTEKHARLGGVGNDCSNWLEDYDNGKREATYLSAFLIVCDALDALDECGYEISTEDVWT